MFGREWRSDLNRAVIHMRRLSAIGDGGATDGHMHPHQRSFRKLLACDAVPGMGVESDWDGPTRSMISRRFFTSPIEM